MDIAGPISILVTPETFIIYSLALKNSTVVAFAIDGYNALSYAFERSVANVSGERTVAYVIRSISLCMYDCQVCPLCFTFSNCSLSRATDKVYNREFLKC